MTSLERKNKRNGIIGTLMIHILLLIAFLFMGLTYKIPPDPKGGILMDFSGEDKDLKDIQLSTTTEIQEQQEVDNKQTTNQETEELITQSEEKTIHVSDSEPESEPESEEKISNELLDALENFKENTDKEGENTDKETGENNSTLSEDSGEGVSSEGNYRLGDRDVVNTPTPYYNIEKARENGSETGTVVVSISVDRHGKVIRHETYICLDCPETTTRNPKLEEWALKAAKKTTFEQRVNAPISQKGKIFYSFEEIAAQ